VKKLNHLAEIYKNYDTYIIDLWGVMHNGVRLNPKAIEVVKNLIQNKKKVVFLSNAPRQSKQVKIFLQKLKMEDKYLQNIMTSGEAAMIKLQKENYGKFFYHLGP
jgi:ribonucleotide monophosphatase NagD (HAD superfamily)